ncbi:recombinase family protein [Embleya sp. NPDC005575]|uniref:recombinase family protein n=1 Tax=Embleya sp. NPDC005575 TaxID=3156892 RepID=UPI0033AC388E
MALRPELDKCRAFLRPGDTLVITRLDRLGRSLSHLIELVAELGKAGIDLKVTEQSIDTTSPGGRLVFHMIAAVAEL